MKCLFALAVVGCIAGCASPAADEADAARQLAPKPLSDKDKAQMDKIKSDFAAPGAVKPGR